MEEKTTIALGPGKPLAYAENKSQNPASHLPIEGNDDVLAMHQFSVLSGDPSYITIADGNQIIGILCLMAETFRQWCGKVPFIVIAGKHGNPCGAAIDWENKAAAIRKALMGDYIAVMGGEVVTNFPISEVEGRELYSPQPENDYACAANIGRDNWGLDVIYAPAFDEETVSALGKREKRRLLGNLYLLEPKLPDDEFELRPVRGGFLKQAMPEFLLHSSTILTAEDEKVQKVLAEHVETFIIVWAVCWRASSNTVALAKNGMLIGLGCGQQDRIACVRLCIDRATRARHDTKGSVFASDAFFPYAQGELSDMDEVDKVLRKEMHSVIGLHSEEGINDARKFFKNFARATAFVNMLDRREGPELLIDAGCIGGVVPFDGRNKEEVKKLFNDAEVAVAFVAPENRGFSKHA